MTYRDEILKAATHLMRRNGEDSFSLADLIAEMRSNRTSYQESTIRTHPTSRLCTNAADHHAVTYSDLERISHGRYRIIAMANEMPHIASDPVPKQTTVPPTKESMTKLVGKAARIAAVAHEH